MAKAEISWKRRAADGEKMEVYAHHVGDRWKFYARERRVGQWTLIEEPPKEDWVSLLDAVKRRVNRRLLRPEEVLRVQRAAQERYPELEFT